EKFKKVSDAKLSAEDLVPRLSIDSQLDLKQINLELVNVLDLFAPFGPQNMRPVFMTRNLQVWGEPHVVGNNHLRLRVKKEGPVFDCIGFGMGDLVKVLCMKGIRIDLAYVVEANYWNDTYKIQLRIKDLKISENLI
ncbi:MAG: single-stranded-DNA-specific exonuclease RecJ, partial [candidate division Zixibacteria bacterium]|nr:single-stranded-DNA-specific exonuclease RecJ [candidate division Zixibacteria bacterium]